MEKKSIFLLLVLCAFAFVTGSRPYRRIVPVKNWTAGFLAKADGGKKYTHFIRLADGTLQSFQPGEAPQTVPGIDHVRAISSSMFHIVALKDDGTVWAWGSNDDGQLGNESLIKWQSARYTSYNSSDIPVQVTGIKKAIAVSTFHSSSYALLSDGTVMAWGSVSHNGFYNIVSWPKPARLPGITEGVALSGAMVLLSDGRILTWGDGVDGRLGNGDTKPSPAPVEVKGITDAVDICSEEEGGLALLQDGTIKAWGDNENGELGSSHVAFSSIPVKVNNIPKVIAVSGYSGSCFALLEDGSVMGWGDARIGALGKKGGDQSGPQKLPGLQQVVGIQAGNFSGMALLANGTVTGWGSGMVSTGIYKQTYTPVKIASFGENAPK